MPDYLFETKERLIKAGKIRFLTSSHHNLMPPGDPENTLEMFSHIYDGFMGGFNFLRGNTLPRKAFSIHRIGIITFKPVQGLRWSSQLKKEAEREGIVPQEAAVRWLLAIPEITSIARLIKNHTQLESNLRAIRTPLSPAEKLFLQRAALDMSNSTCDLCRICTEACPHGISVVDIQRCRLYVEGFEDMARAKELYFSLGKTNSFLSCQNCGTCERVCPKHLPIRHSMAITHNILTP
jgi:predicted aldo/keto reductase-like oxidoreductase